MSSNYPLLHDRITQNERLMMGNRRDNTGQPYEILVQAIFQAIHDQEDVATIVVERNKTLQGKTTPHQIDVYWKFKKGGITYEAIVQAKDWQSRVKLGQLLEFKGVLDDLPGQPRGIFVTRSGYQRGAKEFAATHGIILYELDEPPRPPNTTITTLGWAKFEAELRSFKLPANNPEHEPVEELAMGLKTTVYEPRYSNILFEIDRAWIAQNPTTNQMGKFPELQPRPITEVILYDQNQAAATNLDAVVREEIAILKNEKSDRKRVVHGFTSDTFIGPPCTDGPFIKINKVSFDLEIEVTETPAHFNLSRFVKLVLREIASDETRTFLAPKT
jgi:Restriction endonuclease